ncbi:hypothetical protein HG717_34290 [Rhodococcus erythropolis]|uniref:hypothetical protein n=1 Tax=Rhodococcus erythropolis TaxID=1833 RepID=UPI001C9A68A7|nr:hypothetical protein [Rhodococcus erythropolis]MBY6388939.1 hypothetical protein [Rhodococcus erythropolis]
MPGVFNRHRHGLNSSHLQLLWLRRFVARAGLSANYDFQIGVVTELSNHSLNDVANAAIAHWLRCELTEMRYLAVVSSDPRFPVERGGIITKRVIREARSDGDNCWFAALASGA